MKQQQGNLIDLAEQGEFDVIVHGCNCFHTMGAGIAREIAMRYPQAKQADDQTEYGTRKKLGNFSCAWVEQGETRFAIINAYTQYKWSGQRDLFEYQEFTNFLNRLCFFLSQLHRETEKVIRVGFPKIGCGLARGNEEKIIGMIESFAKDVSPWAIVSLVVN